MVAAAEPVGDPVSAFFDSAGRAIPMPPHADEVQQELDETIADALANPLEFAACRAPPSAVATTLQVGVVTQQVLQLLLGGGEATVVEQPSLLSDVPPPIIAAPPQKRPSVPPKTRASSTPVRQSARQAESKCKVLVT